MKHICYLTKEDLLNDINKFSKNENLILILKNKFITNWFICINSKIRVMSFNSSASTIEMDDDFDVIRNICMGHDYEEMFVDITNNFIEAIEEYDRLNQTCSDFISQFLGGIQIA